MLVYTVGLFVPIMEPDAAVYAQVSMEMYDRGDYLSIYHKGVDWLDKPHFPFWMSALSFEVFGVNTFAYKLPAVIFVLLGALYTYLFGKKFYSALHGWIAVLILITAEHIIISNQDVRAEPFMTGLMIMGLYHLASLLPRKGISVQQQIPVGYYGSAQTIRGLQQGRAGMVGSSTSSTWFWHLVAGALACACLIMTKGLFTIIPIAAGIGLTLVYHKQWSEIIHWRWLLFLLFMALFLTPAVYGYYQQFDKHPEKLVFGQHGVSGVEFFLWTSQWGRFTNTGPITGKGDPTFFIHTMLWAFLPWAFVAFFALFKKAQQLFKGITIGENYSFFGFATLFLIFSASKFQLSFYLNPIFPLLAIVTSAVLLQQSRRVVKIFSTIHYVLCILLAIALVALHYFFSGTMPHIDSIIVVFAGFAMGFYLFTRKNMYLKKALFATALIVVSLNYYLNRDFYPALLSYQAESEAAHFMRNNRIAAEQVVFADEMQSIADVIMHAPTKVIPVDSMTFSNVSGRYVFTTEVGKGKLDSLGLRYDVVKEFGDFPVTRLTGKFINRNTRHLEVKKKYLLKTGLIDMRKPRSDISRRDS